MTDIRYLLNIGRDHARTKRQRDIEYGRLRRRREAERTRARCRTWVARFLGAIRVAPNGCWEWQGSLTKGYATFRLGKRTIPGHRLSHLAYKGPIPSGYHVDHLCMNPRCVNPDHLEAVVAAENARRYWSKTPTCRHGHTRTEANTRITVDGYRRCRDCDRIRWAA